MMYHMYDANEKPYFLVMQAEKAVGVFIPQIGENILIKVDIFILITACIVMQNIMCIVTNKRNKWGYSIKATANKALQRSLGTRRNFRILARR